jgi:serine/threonine-protein kinase
MGEVYEVVHQELGRHFALKLLRAELASDTDTVARFHREPRAVAKLVSEHIVSIVDCGELSCGTPYFVMERLYGRDLRRLLKEEGSLPAARVAHLAVDACRGLSCAHCEGLVHRDLKPENLFLTARDDGRELCKLLDFGVVKSARDNTTGAGGLLGTPRYMAPEQLGLDVPVSPQTDLFALGVIMYECLTGRAPFEGDSVERVLFKIMAERETPIHELLPELPAGLSALVTRALSKKPEGRPESALAFAEALVPYAQEAAPLRAFSKWRLHVAEAAPESDADQDPTPRELDRAALAIARNSSRRVGHGWRAYRSVGVGVSVGLALGAVLTLAILRRPADHSASPTAAAPSATQVPTPKPTPSAVPDEPGIVASALATASSATASSATASSATDARPSLHFLKSKPGAATNARPPSAPPAASFDPHNPYAP